MINTKKIGSNIKKFRELKGLTQENMAADLNMSQTGYGKIERGETDISISKLESIAGILGLTINDVIDFDEKTFFYGNVVNNKNSNEPNSQQAGIIIGNENFNNERKLFEDQIQILKQQNLQLTEQNQQLNKQIEFLQKLIDK